MNGRINFEGGTPFFLQDKIVKDSRTTYDNLKYSQQNTVVSKLFFSYFMILKLFLIFIIFERKDSHLSQRNNNTIDKLARHSYHN